MTEAVPPCAGTDSVIAAVPSLDANQASLMGPRAAAYAGHHEAVQGVRCPGHFKQVGFKQSSIGAWHRRFGACTSGRPSRRSAFDRMEELATGAYSKVAAVFAREQAPRGGEGSACARLGTVLATSDLRFLARRRYVVARPAARSPLSAQCAIRSLAPGVGAACRGRRRRCRAGRRPPPRAGHLGRRR
jgi:hypothetical protein